MATYDIYPQPFDPAARAAGLRVRTTWVAATWSAIRKAPMWAAMRNVAAYVGDPDAPGSGPARRDPRDDLRFMR